MIVDDNWLNRSSLQNILLKFKDEFELEIILEDDGSTAIETFKKRN